MPDLCIFDALETVTKYWKTDTQFNAGDLSTAPLDMQTPQQMTNKFKYREFGSVDARVLIEFPLEYD